MLRGGNRPRVDGGVEQARTGQMLQELVGTVLPERHLRRADLIDGVRVAVVEHNRTTRIRERESEWQTDATTAADDRYVSREFHELQIPPAARRIIRE